MSRGRSTSKSPSFITAGTCTGPSGPLAPGYLLQGGDLDAAIGPASGIGAARIGGPVEIRPVVERLPLIDQVVRDEWRRVVASLVGFFRDLDLAEEAA
jgi:hypothetical protein